MKKILFIILFLIIGIILISKKNDYSIIVDAHTQFLKQFIEITETIQRTHYNPKIFQTRSEEVFQKVLKNEIDPHNIIFGKDDPLLKKINMLKLIEYYDYNHIENIKNHYNASIKKIKKYSKSYCINNLDQKRKNINIFFNKIKVDYLTSHMKKITRETYQKRYCSFLKDKLSSLKEMSYKDLYTIFLNSYIKLYDAHSLFFDDNTDFKKRINDVSNNLGIILKKENQKFKVKEISFGSAAFFNNNLLKDDIINAVFLKDHNKMVNLSPDRTIEDIQRDLNKSKDLTFYLLRDNKKVFFVFNQKDFRNYEDKVHSYIIENKSQKTGFIKVRSFYQNDYSSIANDFNNILIDMNENNIESIIIDLRNNHGGHLIPTLQMISLLIDNEDLLIVKGRKEEISIQNHQDLKKIYFGKIFILINEESASASEIFAGVLQEYKRAFIIGEYSQSFGKGSVQAFTSFNNSEKSSLLTTINKYYLPSGKSIQLKGVKPNIHIPYDQYKELFLEKRYVTYLKFDQIQAKSLILNHDYNSNYLHFQYNKDLVNLFNQNITLIKNVYNNEFINEKKFFKILNNIKSNNKIISTHIENSLLSLKTTYNDIYFDQKNENFNKFINNQNELMIKKDDITLYSTLNYIFNNSL